MKGEIDKDFYCSAGLHRDGDCTVCLCGCETCKIDCDNYHRKYPTPEQFKEEYGEEYSDDGAVYCYKDWSNKWTATEFIWCKQNSELTDIIVCACTPFGKPDKDWRPE